MAAGVERIPYASAATPGSTPADGLERRWLPSDWYPHLVCKGYCEPVPQVSRVLLLHFGQHLEEASAVKDFSRAMQSGSGPVNMPYLKAIFPHLLTEMHHVRVS